MTYFLAEFGLIRRAADFANIATPDLQSGVNGAASPTHLAIPDFKSGMLGAASPTQPLPQPNEIFLPDAAFDSLKAFAISQEADQIMAFFVQKGCECLRLKNYVGLLETPDGTQIEILPKTASNAAEGRATVLKMLRCLPDAPFRSLPTASLQSTSLPLWEVFITAFLEEVTKIVQHGLQKSYVTTEENQPFLRGKLLIEKQLSQNIFRQEQFAVAHDEFLENIAPNRILKSCVLTLQRQSRSFSNQNRLRQLRFVLEDIPASPHVETDLLAIQTTDRRFDRYATALQWAAVLLRARSWAGQAGKHPNTSLLFPTERLFEAYVTRGFRQHLPDFEVIAQDRSQHLINSHDGKQKFGLRPDLILRKNGKVLILDMKWKWIDASQPYKNYGIDQADLYQLYAYGQKYEADSVFLIYPQHAAFTQPLAIFQYNESLRLQVLPFNMALPLSEAIKACNKLFE